MRKNSLGFWGMQRGSGAIKIMENQLTISQYCTIKNHQVLVDGKVVFQDKADSELKDYFKALYSYLGIEYGKFFKMDSICKLAFTAAELLLKDSDFLDKYQRDRIGILLSNASSSLDTDRRHQATIIDSEQYFPSPSLFVYTLPSIMNGEIAIRHGIQGENNFFVADAFSPTLLVEQVECLFAGNYIDACITGWVDIRNGKEEVIMMLVEKGNGMEFSLEEIQKAS